MVCVHFFVYPEPSLLNTLSVVATSQGHLADGHCVFDGILRTRVCIITTFVSDLVLLAFMISGVLRWKGIQERGGTWWLLYKQASLTDSADGEMVTLIVSLMLALRVWHGLYFSHLPRCLLWCVCPVVSLQLVLHMYLMAHLQVFIILNLNGE